MPWNTKAILFIKNAWNSELIIYWTKRKLIKLFFFSNTVENRNFVENRNSPIKNVDAVSSIYA